MLIAVIKANDYTQAKQQISFILNKVDGIELRLDYWHQLDISAIKQLRDECVLPMIFTLRKQAQGGHYFYDEAKRLSIIISLCELNPDYLDLEYDIDNDFYHKIISCYPHINLICSYHNYVQTVDNLTVLLHDLQHKMPGAAIYKIVMTARSSIDTLRMLYFIYTQKNIKIVGICMGEHGAATRILGPVVGNYFSYACISATTLTAPGQLSVDELLDIYHFRQLNADSKIYALLGNPIDKSVGHLLHNNAIRLLQINAIYVRFCSASAELREIIDLCRLLPFAGFSLTMPLKEVGLQLVDVIDDEAGKIGAINSIIVEKDCWTGFNTDGLGAMTVLTKKVNLTNKRVVIMGAGGVARAIGYSAVSCGANVIILNRHHERAMQLANEFGCESGKLNQLIAVSKDSYDVLINTLPLETCMPYKALIPEALVMEVNYQPLDTKLVTMAELLQCEVITGDYLYIEQALLQLQRWFYLSSQQLNGVRAMMLDFFNQVRRGESINSPYS
jgi:3-dehydroquinate dehydratase/shikimate dehydrogenase